MLRFVEAERSQFSDYCIVNRGGFLLSVLANSMKGVHVHHFDSAIARYLIHSNSRRSCSKPIIEIPMKKMAQATRLKRNNQPGRSSRGRKTIKMTSVCKAD